MAGLAALAMLSGVSISFGRERQPPREKTDEDRKRIAAAELKRARKNARRLGLVAVECTEFGGCSRRWKGTVRGVRITIDVSECHSFNGVSDGFWWDRSYGERVLVDYQTYATADEAELAGLLAFAKAVAEDGAL